MGDNDDFSAGGYGLGKSHTWLLSLLFPNRVDVAVESGRYASWGGMACATGPFLVPTAEAFRALRRGQKLSTSSARTRPFC